MPFPIDVSSPVRFPGPPPSAADVVVVGGGVIGVMTAWFLAKRGVKVVLCEKGRIAGEQSSRNWGWVRKQGRDPAELPVMIEAMSIWKGLAEEVGADLGFRQTGVLYAANTAKAMAGYEAWMGHARAHGLDTKLLGQAELQAMLPNAAGWIGGLWTASDARAEPWIAVTRLADALATKGVSVVENCAVRALDVSAGRVSGVVTESGRIRADRVVLAGGAWSSLLARRHGVNLPQLSVRATVTATEPMPEIWSGAVADSHFAIRRRADGGYTLAGGHFHEFFIGPDAFRHLGAYWTQIRADISGTRFLPAAPGGYPDAWGTKRFWGEDDESPFERMRILSPDPNMTMVERLRDRFAAAFPAVGRPGIAQAWAGMIDTMPDVVPVIDHVAALPGLTMATGMSAHGFGIGPGVGRVVADLVEGRAPGHDLSRFRFGRFSDGSKIVLGPSL
ncbi:FAD-binding oxidoreductase [Defluviimonas sp. WL0050]|uniref:FAD-binding oxidoreductase n=1 Tax=Albidovulum litorale TaxID=2984134 RepID=A0ABT2ZRI2_9RHOB|nr:FAD-binding oxidoreductase [Defluviimonas sp. WL0050]MCV2873550.1 FAD-binding oxidoreductase [Defluviimonas sp. WL0050]